MQTIHKFQNNNFTNVTPHSQKSLKFHEDDSLPKLSTDIYKEWNI
jgi:hypothetical protein